MKKMIMFALLFFVVNVNAGWFIFCDQATTYEIVSEDGETIDSLVMLAQRSENSRFKLNDNVTVLGHITEDLESIYYANGESNFNESTSILEMPVISDAGNKYTFIFDPSNNMVSALFKQKGILYSVVYRIKYQHEYEE